MIYRRTRAADRLAVRAVAESMGIDYDGREPLVGFVAETEQGEFKGCSFAHDAVVIDPFICNIPMSAMKLFYLTEGALSALNKHNIVIQVSAENRKLMDEVERLGFGRVDGKKFQLFKKVM